MRSFGRLFVALLIVLGITLYLKVGVNILEKVRGKSVQFEMQMIDRILSSEKMTRGRFPHDLAAVHEQMRTESGRESGEDPYGTEYSYRKQRGGYILASAGKDKRFGTEDDVTLIKDKRGQTSFLEGAVELPEKVAKTIQVDSEESLAEVRDFLFEAKPDTSLSGAGLEEIRGIFQKAFER